ncbi:hypothetical protein [Levilactobacillus tujiorum]|uniref:hypothetical protein n=1 Tax=Levilactobacillus tujiorum TaxID=2912243 RepID=UPI0014571AB2|nr:hypothetical protein [Levilactobacillus tujiorum]NLR32620.1 hypothetical protein [Levilactobacillus tujiorum]
MARIPLQGVNKALVESKEIRNLFVDHKRTDKVEGINLLAYPLGKLVDVMKPKGMIKIKLPNEKFEVQEGQKVELINLTVTPYTRLGEKFVRYSYNADGFKPIGSDGMSSEGDEE